MYKYEQLGLEQIDPNEVKIGDVIAVARDQITAWSTIKTITDKIKDL